MYDKFSVAAGHSKLSDRAVLAARDLAVLSQGEVWILHLREREVGFKTGATIMDGTKDDAAAAVSAAVEVLTQAGVKAHGEVRSAE
jgi:nucleotide-binding universal stress UspA family protein